MEGWYKKMIKVIIAGSRTFSDYSLLATVCDHMLQNQDEVEIVSGGAKGADKLGELYAEENGYEVRQFLANLTFHGNAAGPLRNKDMAEYSDALIAFWDGKSRGTLNMIQVARAEGLKVKICSYE